MELQFTFSEGYVASKTIPDDLLELGRNWAEQSNSNSWSAPVETFTITPPLNVKFVCLVFYAESIHAWIPLEGKRLESTNWYGYDGEQGDEGPGNEDDEDSDEDDDSVGDKV